MKKFDLEQISFFIYEEIPIDKPKTIEKPKIQWGATICTECLCSKCIKNCEFHVSNTTIEEARTIKEPCWNCDECYFYGMDDETLNKNIVKFECKEFEMSKYHIDLMARKQRKKFKVINV